MTNGHQRPTLEEVAKRAHVSSTTASDALKNLPRVHDETRTRVLEAARALGYRADPAGLQFRQRTGFTIGAHIPTQDSEALRTGSGFLWSSIGLTFGQSLSKYRANLLTIDSIERFAGSILPVHAFVTVSQEDGPPTIPALPFGAPVWIANTHGPAADGIATIEYDYAEIAAAAIGFVAAQSPERRVELWIRNSSDLAPLTRKITGALDEAARTSGREIVECSVAPDADHITAEVNRHRNTNPRSPVLCWGLDPTLLRGLQSEAPVLSFGEGQLETNALPHLPYLAFDIPTAAQTVAQEVIRCLVEGDAPRDIVLHHRLCIGER